jgi:hypothetical protein
MEHNLVHALSELGIFLWQEQDTNSIVARLPRGPTIFGAVHTSGRHSHVHAVCMYGPHDLLIAIDKKSAQPNSWPGCKQRIRSAVNDRIGIEPPA